MTLPSAALLNLLWVQHVRGRLGSGVWDGLVLLVCRVIYLIFVDNLTLLLTSFLLLFLLFLIRLIHHTYTVIDAHSTHFYPKELG